MPSPGTYSFTIHPTDGSVEHTADASLTLSCCLYSHYILDPLTPLQDPPGGGECDHGYLPPFYEGFPETPGFISFGWTVTFYDTCGSIIGTETGTINVGYDFSFGDCNVSHLVFSGDTFFTDPLGATHPIPVSCGCV